MPSELQQFVGERYVFPDGAALTITQIKMRDNGYWITYETQYGDALPRKLLLPESEFIQNFGHLFIS